MLQLNIMQGYNASIYFIGFWIAYQAQCRPRQQRARRRYAVRPLNRARRQQGHFSNLVAYVKENDPEQFFKYTRMTSMQYDHLLELVERQLRKRPTKFTLSPSQQLAMTLQ